MIYVSEICNRLNKNGFGVLDTLGGTSSDAQIWVTCCIHQPVFVPKSWSITYNSKCEKIEKTRQKLRPDIL